MVEGHVKERLTGAIILVVFLVLLVPELLSGPGRSSGAPTHTTNADGGQMRSYTIDLADDSGAPRSTSAPVVESPTPAPAQRSVSAANTPAASDTTKDSAVPPAVPASDTVSAASADVQNDAPSEAPAASEPGAPTKAVPAPQVPARAAAPPARAAVPDAPAKGSWFVQVGVFASRENADRLSRQLKGKGFAVIVDESPGKGKRLYRVRVGPEGDRAAALSLGAKLRAAGHSGSVIPGP